MQNRKYQVFISSTYSDLVEERKKVLDVLLMADCIPAGMEAFVATDVEQFEVIKKVIDLCDYYILIIGQRYGSINPDTGISYTEMEYDYAIKNKIPVLVFVLDEQIVLPDDKKENEPDIVYFGYSEEYESTNEKYIKYGYVSQKDKIYTGEEFAIAELKQRNLYAAACFGIYNREFIVRNNLYFESGLLHEDELWTPQVILRANKVYTSDYVFYHYLRRNGSITRSGNKTKHGQDMLCICKKLDILANEIKNPELKKYMDNHIAMLYMKGMTEGRLYQTNMEIDRFYPLRKVCFKKDRAKAILFAFSLRLYYRINIMKTQG